QHFDDRWRSRSHSACWRLLLAAPSHGCGTISRSVDPDSCRSLAPIANTGGEAMNHRRQYAWAVLAGRIARHRARSLRPQGQLYVVGFAVCCAALEIFSRYERYTAVLKWISFVLLAYVIVVLLVNVPWGRVLYQTFVPHFMLTTDYVVTMVAVL